MEDNRKWNGRWIWHEGLPRASKTGEHELVCFRRTFAAPEESVCRLVAHVTADSRYRLYLNGESVSVGPCKGDAWRHHYETVDLSDKIRPGRNTLAVKVLHYAGGEPWAMPHGGPISVWRSGAGGFLFDGALVSETGGVLEALHSDERWLCHKDEAFAIEPEWLVQWLGGFERVDGGKRPHGWERPEFDDSGWARAVPFYAVRNEYGELTPWRLAPRPIPALYEREAAFRGWTRRDGGSEEGIRSLLAGAGAGLTVQPGESFWVELDAGELSTGYLRLAISGGRGRDVRLLGSEAYEHQDGNGKWIKDVRDKAEGGRLNGGADRYRVAGSGTAEAGAHEVYEPFWFRTFRYVRLEVAAGDAPITLHALSFRDTGYPLEVSGRFACSDPEFAELWDLSVRTLRRCMHETYEDCPYYEQLQYTADTRLQMLFTYNISGDDRLARRAIDDYHSSAFPSGMLQSRYPSMYPQVIPSFSLYWIHMIYEHYLHFGDSGLVKRYRPQMAALLDWFDRRLTEDGIVGATPDAYWTTFDWVAEWPGGAPDAKRIGPLSLLSLMYAAALERAEQLFEWTGWHDAAAEFGAKRAAVNAAVKRVCWSPEKRMFRDGPDADIFSQHAQVWAVLAGAVAGEEAGELLERTLADRSLPVVSLPMVFSLFRALERAGRYGLGFEQWDRWRVFTVQHLSTLPEIAHDVPRSDCHAWSAVPLAEFPNAVLGVTPAVPGYARIRVAPQPGPLTWANGTVATPHGPVDVDWTAENGTFRIRIAAPTGIPIELRLPDGTVQTLEGESAYEAACPFAASQA